MLEQVLVYGIIESKDGFYNESNHFILFNNKKGKKLEFRLSKIHLSDLKHVNTWIQFFLLDLSNICPKKSLKFNWSILL